MSVNELKNRIALRKIGSHFLRAINVLQRLIEKYLKEVQKISNSNINNEERVSFIAE